MLNKIIAFTLFLSIGLLISCSESTTGPNQETDTEQEEQQDDNDETTVTTGTLEVTTKTSGNTQDEDGYTVAVADNNSKPVGGDETVMFEELEEGSYSVELSGLASACSVDGDNPVSVAVTAEETTSVEFNAICDEVTAEGTIVFSQRVDGVFEIFSVQADGTGKQQLTESGKESSWVDISPDGSKIAFARRDMATTKYDIWVMGIDGSNPMKLTASSSNDRHPSWSPDGSQIVYETEKDGNFNIYITDSDGSGQVQLTSNETQDIQPDWAPEGDKIVFTSDDNEDGISDIFVINADGTGLEKLVEATISNGINLFDPAWSPDASKIAYQGFVSNGAATVFTVDADGSNAEVVTDSEFSAFHPTWSPDGNFIAFTNLASANNSDEIWIIGTDGSNGQKLISDEETRTGFPSWGVTAD